LRGLIIGKILFVCNR